MREYLFLDADGDDILPELRFELMWIQDGCGLGMSFGDLEEMDLADFADLLGLCREQRQRIAAASKPGGR